MREYEKRLILAQKIKIYLDGYHFEDRILEHLLLSIVEWEIASDTEPYNEQHFFCTEDDLVMRFHDYVASMK